MWNAPYKIAMSQIKTLSLCEQIEQLLSDLALVVLAAPLLLLDIQ